MYALFNVNVHVHVHVCVHVQVQYACTVASILTLSNESIKNKQVKKIDE